jgi:hypothetical protein
MNNIDIHIPMSVPKIIWSRLCKPSHILVNGAKIMMIIEMMAFKLYLPSPKY